MAVFTQVSFDEAAGLVSTLGIGTLTKLDGIAAGIENTNYFADTTQGRFVLTLFERLSFEQLPFYLQLMRHLAEHGVAVPTPRADSAGRILHTLQGKPAAVVDRLRGRHELAPGLEHGRRVGAALAGMHVAGRDFGLRQPNLRGLAWCAQTAPAIMPFLTPAQRDLLLDELAYQQAQANLLSPLPEGPIHADLFRDNVMFDGSELSGFFDFYFAATDRLAYDIAVCLNDWCLDLATGVLDVARAQAFVAAYDAGRRLGDDELAALPALMRLGALRFWVSRLWDLHLPRDASVLKAHDPEHFERVLRRRRDTAWQYRRDAGAVSA